MSLMRKFGPTKLLPEGKQVGIIKKLDLRSDPYNYIDIYVEFPSKENGLTIKLGCPDNLSKTSRLGMILANFGVDPENYVTEIDLEKLLVGKKVTCLVKNKKTERGVFSEIIADTLKPLEK